MKINMTAETKKFLDNEAKSEGKSMSAEVREILIGWLCGDWDVDQSMYNNYDKELVENFKNAQKTAINVNLDTKGCSSIAFELSGVSENLFDEEHSPRWLAEMLLYKYTIEYCEKK